MSKNPDIPDDWSKPADLAKRISELVNNKPYSPEDDLKEAIDDLARDIAIIEPKSQDWDGWVSYSLEEMESQAYKCRLINNYGQALETFADKIQTRVKCRKW